MRFLVYLALAWVIVASSSLTLSGWALKQRFDQGKKTRIEICRRENVLRKILHDEHVVKLERAEQYLKDHPNGLPGIPRVLILQGILDEKNIAEKTLPLVCR